MKADTNLHFLGPSPTDFGNKDGYFYFFQSPCQLGLKPQLSFQNYSHNNSVWCGLKQPVPSMDQFFSLFHLCNGQGVGNQKKID
jgi:hypothetical protein